MKNIFKVVFILSFYSGLAQKYVDAKIITLANDTINSRLKIATNIFDRKLIDEASFFRTLVLIDENGKKTQKIKAANVKALSFTDLNNKNVLYVNNGKVLKKVMYNGSKIKWYWDIAQNLYDGSIQYSEYFIDDKGAKHKMGLFKGRKSTLLEITKSKPELASEIESTELTNDNMILLLEKFENL